MLHRFRHSIASFSLPTRLNNPFHYTPHPLCELAARELRAYLCERKEWTEELSAGKMFGAGREGSSRNCGLSGRIFR